MNIEPTEGNQNYIGRLTNSLKKLGLIYMKTDKEVITLENGMTKCVKHNYYRLTTYEEWKNKE